MSMYILVSNELYKLILIGLNFENEEYEKYFEYHELLMI